MSIINIPTQTINLETKQIVVESIKDQVARVGKVGVILERDYLQKPTIRLDIYEDKSSHIVGASTDIHVIGRAMEHYVISNKYVRLLASSRLHEAIREALIYYRYEMDEYELELEKTRPINILRSFCLDTEIPFVNVVNFTVDKLKEKGFNNSSYTRDKESKYLNELSRLRNNDFFKHIATLTNTTTKKAENRFAEGVLAFWMLNNLDMSADDIDVSFDWEEGKAEGVLKAHIFFLLDIHHAIENKIL